MARKATTTEVILDALAVAGRECSFEELMSTCPGLTWNQIFLEVDRLTRDNLVQLSHDKHGVYCVRLPKASSSALAVMGER